MSVGPDGGECRVWFAGVLDVMRHLAIICLTTQSRSGEKCGYILLVTGWRVRSYM